MLNNITSENILVLIFIFTFVQTNTHMCKRLLICYNKVHEKHIGINFFLVFSVGIYSISTETLNLRLIISRFNSKCRDFWRENIYIGIYKVLHGHAVNF
jgi:hypothetical protein